MIFDLIQLFSALILAVYLMQLIKSFSYMSLEELQRRTERGDRKAERVLIARLHGLKLWAVLWTLLIFMVVAIVVVMDNLLPVWLAIFVDVGILVTLIFVLPWAKWPAPNLASAAFAGPVLGVILDKLGILFRLFRPFRFSQRISTDLPFYIHSKEHLLDIIKRLKSQTKNPDVLSDLNLAIGSLTFGSKKIKTLLTPLGAIKTLEVNQVLSPKLLAELHDSKQTIFPVQHPADQRFIGTFYLQDIKLPVKTDLMINEVMRPAVYYVNTDASLSQVITAFLKTQQTLFLVVNQSQKILGVITVSDVLERYFASGTLADFQYYDDLKLVAAQFAPATKVAPTESSPPAELAPEADQAGEVVVEDEPAPEIEQQEEVVADEPIIETVAPVEATKPKAKSKPKKRRGRRPKRNE